MSPVLGHNADVSGLASDVCSLRDIVAKVENRSVPKISRKLIFGLSAAASPCFLFFFATWLSSSLLLLRIKGLVITSPLGSKKMASRI
jgi:hypothetical protein